jgi:3,4-dihydroxy 2-butanone 4-phosphate synthase/GTP cyclohydrolase II
MDPQPQRDERASLPTCVARVPLPTAFGEFTAAAFECSSGFVYLVLILGDIAEDEPVLTRVLSECLTGDALGSLRCDCGVQLRAALRRIAGAGRGVLVYATSHEGRGIGLVDKLRAYIEQDQGADTVDANLRLGLGADLRDYTDSASILQALGVRRVRLLSNNPRKAAELRAAGANVESVEGLATAAHTRNLAYLQTKQDRLGHLLPTGPPVEPFGGTAIDATAIDATALVGDVARRHAERPWVVLKYAQTIDGRIATSTGDSKWISGARERQLSHALRAACDAVLVGVGTVLNDDPQLTVRLVPGACPVRIALDTQLRTPPTAKILSHETPTILVASTSAPADRRSTLEATGARIRTVAPGPGGVDVTAAFHDLADLGVRTLLVEGGARVITSLLRARLVDRLIISVSPTVLGAGTEAVGELGSTRVTDGVRLVNRSVHLVDDDVVFAFDVSFASASTHGNGAEEDRALQ